jgi:E3 ubiquitin-protein transferase RMND5
MDSLQKDHERLIKRSKLSKSIDEIQKTIDLLQSARSTIAESK